MKIGVLGAGQLGKMLALAGYPLGFEFHFLDPTEGSPAGRVAPQTVAAYTDGEGLERLSACDVVTFEFENVPDAAARQLSAATRVFPPPAALEVAQDRWVEKSCFRKLAIRTPRFERVDDEESLHQAAAKLGLPCLLKTRRFGYDGKGQFLLRRLDDVPEALTALGRQPLIAEEYVQFDRELSLVAVRGEDGQTASYPLIENRHAGGILRTSVAPARASDAIHTQAAQSARRLLDHLGYVGVLTVEFFDVNGELLANEFAPRVHNSGHLTIEAAVTSQFENHLRAVAGLPLGSTELHCHAAMLNLVGELPPKPAVLGIGGAHYHDYQKQIRPGRKVGHITLTAPNEARLREALRAAEPLLGV